jgi:endonuclease/exonuclease/phosphatase family metal-dependent hydrolase
MCKCKMSALLGPKSTIGLFRRFSCSAVRGTKTVLAVLAILASVLAWGSAPVRADDNDGDLGNHQVRVLSQNMYVGASLGILLGATSLTDLINTKIPLFSNNILATKADERAAAMAAEIAKQRPDFVALSEAWMLTARGIKMDLLESVLEALKALGQPYELACAGPVCGTVNQEDLNLTSFGVDFHLTDRNAILMRTDVDIATIDVQSKQFSPITLPTLPPPLNQIAIHGGYVWVDAMVRGLPLRFVSVHLIPNAGTIVSHAQELFNPGAAADTTLPLVFGGDFNTHVDPLIYQTLINAHTGPPLTDAWKLLHPNQPGFTCCQNADLLNATTFPTFKLRIDLILFRGLAGVSNMKVFGDKPQTDRTPSGLWPSDHAGIVATLAGPESQQFVADK